ncbi:MAG: hypothetical protein ABSC56_04630 [Solirubrobacteraceae bacterium]
MQRVDQLGLDMIGGLGGALDIRPALRWFRIYVGPGPTSSSYYQPGTRTL